jgi:hypothetical protein
MTAPLLSSAATFRAAHVPALGARILIDGWRMTETLVPSDWDRAPFRITTKQRSGGAYLPTPSGMIELACRVDVTGRSVQIVNGSCAVRVRVALINDDEPDSILSGWMFV